MPSRVEVAVTEEEFVAGRGMGVVRWFVRVNDGWVPCSRHATARRTQLEARAGRVYCAQVELAVAPGARLLRVVTRPRAGRRSVLEYLCRSVATERVVTRDYYAVGRRGELVRVSELSGKGSGAHRGDTRRSERVERGQQGKGQAGEWDRRASEHARQER